MNCELPQSGAGPRIGCGALIRDDQDRILLVKRNRRPEAGHWGLPGGKVEAMETLEAATVRELREELGILIRPGRILSVSDQIDHRAGEHWVSIVYLASIISGLPGICEPGVLSDFGWFAIDALPDRLTLATRDSIEAVGIAGN